MVSLAEEELDLLSRARNAAERAPMRAEPLMISDRLTKRRVLGVLQRLAEHALALAPAGLVCETLVTHGALEVMAESFGGGWPCYRFLEIPLEI